MSAFYEKMRNVANKLLSSELGQTGITYIHVTAGGGAADDPGANTETSYTVVGSAKGVSASFVDGTTIVASDIEIFMVGRSDVTPNINGFMVVNSERCKIVQVMPVPAADTPVGWKIIVRK
jgi:hypothetical protein